MLQHARRTNAEKVRRNKHVSLPVRLAIFRIAILGVFLFFNVRLTRRPHTPNAQPVMSDSEATIFSQIKDLWPTNEVVYLKAQGAVVM